MDSGQSFIPSSRSPPKRFEDPAIFPAGSGPDMDYSSQNNHISLPSRKPKNVSSTKVKKEENSWSSPFQSGETVRFRPSSRPGLNLSRERYNSSVSLHGEGNQFTEYRGRPGNGPSYGTGEQRLSPFERAEDQNQTYKQKAPRMSSASGPGVFPHEETAVPKPRARKSRQGVYQAGFMGTGHMPPPVGDFASGKKTAREGKKMKNGSKSGNRALKMAKEVQERWKAVEDAHHTRLIDLYNLKPGEEVDFEQELAAGSREQVGKPKMMTNGKMSGRKEVPRLSSLRLPKGSDVEHASSSGVEFEEPNGQAVKVISKCRPTAVPEERYRKPVVGGLDLEIFEQYYGAKKRIQTTLKRAKPLMTMTRRPDNGNTKSGAMFSLKRENDDDAAHSSLFDLAAHSHPAADWGHAAFAPTGRHAKSPRTMEDMDVGSLPSASSTPSRADSEMLSTSDAEDENRKKILAQLQKLNDKRARLEAQLTKIQKNNTSSPAAGLGSSMYEPADHSSLLPSKKFKLEMKPSLQQVLLRIVPAVERDPVTEQWKIIATKFIPVAVRIRNSQRMEKISRRVKVNAACLRDHTENRFESERLGREHVQRAKFMVRDMFARWKVIDKEERKYKRLQEKQEMEQKRIDLELHEARRQQRKLNFLITQTELYAHFMSKKISGTTDQDAAKDKEILEKLNDTSSVPVTVDVELDPTEALVGEKAKEDIVRNVELAFSATQKKAASYNDKSGVIDESKIAALNPTEEKILGEPSMFQGKLKIYQKKGISWLASLFSNGINGILADEMGLGKTVQSIAFLAHVAEECGIWGPFLIVAPASTLPNWQQEFHRFVPKFKVVPYWGDADQRKILRQFWKTDKLHTEQATYHVVVTSYQLVVSEALYLKRINWQYMILDEAQAIKSSTSMRWRTLLDFPCRNRLLLTGTPIQNSMAELWALLHFIMPSLFDSHMEFNEWFSRDIENHAENKSQMDEKHLSRLHMILKPFMMRRIKHDVEEELSDKVEIMLNCPLTRRQQNLYEALKRKISIEDLLHAEASALNAQSDTTSSLLNLVMQFRKVCNHPELFERRDVRSPAFGSGLEIRMPKLVTRDCILPCKKTPTDRLIEKYFLLSNPHNTSAASGRNGKGHVESSLLAFCQFFPVHRNDLHRIFSAGWFQFYLLWWNLKRRRQITYADYIRRIWANRREKPTRDMFMINLTAPFSDESVERSSPGWIVWDSETRRHTYGSCKVHYIADITDQKSPGKGKDPETESFTATEDSQAEAKIEESRGPRLVANYPMRIPNFFSCYVPKAVCRPGFVYSYDRLFEDENKLLTMRNAKAEHRELLQYGSKELTECRWYNWNWFREVKPGGILGTRAERGWSPMEIPDKQHLIIDSGKLRVLDSLLHRLKDEGHRVLIYSLMTKMMDILEEFMVYKRYPYIRLDGSSKISDRRDMVNDFQTRDDIFVFLLSTRAGGLGINLTAADTVIFYDSDWNPTVDQQAMDRAHRLGQTKQVTVYRLICRNTVEERILQRAQEKSEIQRMVISGGDYRPDTLKPTEVVSLLLDDDEIKSRLMQKEMDMRDPGGRKGWGKRRAPARQLGSSSKKKSSKKSSRLSDGMPASVKPTSKKKAVPSAKAIATPGSAVVPLPSGSTSITIPPGKNAKKSGKPKKPSGRKVPKVPDAVLSNALSSSFSAGAPPVDGAPSVLLRGQLSPELIAPSKPALQVPAADPSPPVENPPYNPLLLPPVSKAKSRPKKPKTEKQGPAVPKAAKSKRKRSLSPGTPGSLPKRPNLES